MLCKKLRLTKRGSFNYVYRVGHSLFTPSIRMVFAKSSSLKIGFSVSNKLGKACVRNKIKRQMRAAARICLKDICGGYQIIFVARLPITKLGFGQILEEMSFLLKKGKLT